MSSAQRWKKRLLGGILFIVLLIMAFLAANYLNNNPASKVFVTDLDYLGVFILALIAGLNFIIPFPAAGFVPIFTAAGLWLPAIVFTLAIGTLLADYIGFLIGRWSRVSVSLKYQKTITKFETIYSNHRQWLPVFVFLFTSFVPLPNEVMILPLAVLGVSFQSIIIPLFIGNLTHQAILAYGIQNIFNWWF